MKSFLATSGICSGLKDIMFVLRDVSEGIERTLEPEAHFKDFEYSEKCSAGIVTAKIR